MTGSGFRKALRMPHRGARIAPSYIAGGLANASAIVAQAVAAIEIH